MCGICGIQSGTRSKWLADSVASMNAALEHRGPDHAGQFDADGCSIAMRRLSIIDLQGGQQPMYNENGALAIVFNGELYNFHAALEPRTDCQIQGVLDPTGASQRRAAHRKACPISTVE